jgi:hypothetical protein
MNKRMGSSMWDWLLPAAVLAGWLVLNRWVLPALGVPT